MDRDTPGKTTRAAEGAAVPQNRQVRVVLSTYNARDNELRMGCRRVTPDGVELIHTAYVHVGTRASVDVPTSVGAVKAAGRVVWCNHLTGSLHEVGVAFCRADEPDPPPPPSFSGRASVSAAVEASQRWRMHRRLNQLSESLMLLIQSGDMERAFGICVDIASVARTLGYEQIAGRAALLSAGLASGEGSGKPANNATAA